MRDDEELKKASIAERVYQYLEKPLYDAIMLPQKM